VGSKPAAMIIGEVALTLGMTRAGVRALERRGHLPAIRTVGGWRLYHVDDVEHNKQLRAQRQNARQPIGQPRYRQQLDSGQQAAPTAESGRSATHRARPPPLPAGLCCGAPTSE
jgi:DNA-binding transcriptional MerR regulator